MRNSLYIVQLAFRHELCTDICELSTHFSCISVRIGKLCRHICEFSLGESKMYRL